MASIFHLKNVLLALLSFLSYINIATRSVHKTGSISVMKTHSRAFAIVALAGLSFAALSVGGCGRRGPLEAPPSAATADKAKTTTITETVPQEDSFAAPQTLNASPIAKPARTSRSVTIPKRDFFLDPIL